LNRKIDHIVYCVLNLEEAILDLEQKLGVKAKIGGAHLTQGTRNALINLGDECYLEILSIDHDNKDIEAPRWMGIDLLQSSKITRWALKANNLLSDSLHLSKYNSKMGEVKGGSRKMLNGQTLTWQIAMPLASPEVDVVPFITDWSDSDVHPTDTLDHLCELVELKLFHPIPDEIKTLFEKLNIKMDVSFSDQPSIGITVKCPKGIVRL